MTTKIRFTGTISFTHPDTDEIHVIEYSRYYVPPKIGKCAEDSYPPEWELELEELPPELNEYEDMLRRDILEYESQMLGDS